MPPLPPVPQTLRIFMEGFIDNDLTYKWGNVLFYRYTGGAPSPTDCGNFAHSIGGGWATHMGPMCPSPTTIQEVFVTDLTSPTSSEGFNLIARAGSRGDDSIPANAAVLMSYPTGGLRYRGGHPRSYVYAGGNADLEGAAHWSSGFRADCQSAWQAFLAGITGLTEGGTTITDHVAVSYRSGGTRRVTPVILTLGDAVAAAEMASQRRRIGRRKHRR